jgi:flagellar biogenesis protein FliO
METVQQTLVVFFVLALLGGTLYWLRSRGVAQFSLPKVARRKECRMQSIERLSLTPQHSLHLVRVESQVLLIAVSPGGCSVVEGKGWEALRDESTLVR